MSDNIPILDLDKILQSKAPKLYKKIPRFVIRYLHRKIHIDELNEILTIYADKQGVDFMDAVVGYFGLRLDVKGLDNLPSDGRYIFVSNHPLGGLDGICLSSVIGGIYGKQIKYVVNDLLYFIKNLQTIFLPVNKHGRQSKETAAIIKAAYDSDNPIITFPAGICSRKINGRITDLEWKKSFIQKSVESKRDIIPVFFDGQNSSFFYRIANIRKRLGVKFNIEMIFLPDEMYKNRNNTFIITFGKPIPYSTFDHSRSASQWAECVKQQVYELLDSNN